MSSKKKSAKSAAAPRDKGLKGMNFMAVQASSTDPEAAIYFYFKRHSSPAAAAAAAAADAGAAEPTLFVANIPLSFSATLVSEIFSCFGAVSEVRFLDRNVPGMKSAVLSAHVVYEDDESVQRAMEFDTTGVIQPAPGIDRPTDCGLYSWMRELAAERPDTEKLQFKVDKFMEVFDETERQAALAAKKGPVVDDDGFTLVPVTKKRTSSAAALQSKQDWERTQREKDAKKPKKEEVVIDFYRHQFRENKRERAFSHEAIACFLILLFRLFFLIFISHTVFIVIVCSPLFFMLQKSPICAANSRPTSRRSKR